MTRLTYMPLTFVLCRQNAFIEYKYYFMIYDFEAFDSEFLANHELAMIKCGVGTTYIFSRL